MGLQRFPHLNLKACVAIYLYGLLLLGVAECFSLCISDPFGITIEAEIHVYMGFMLQSIVEMVAVMPMFRSSKATILSSVPLNPTKSPGRVAGSPSSALSDPVFGGRFPY